MLDDKSSRLLTPGEHLKQEMSRRGFDQAELAKAVDMSRQVINYVVNGRKPISRSLAMELGRVMGLPEDYWLRSEFLDLPAADQVSGGHPRPGSELAPGMLVDFLIKDAVARGLIDIDPFSESAVKQASVDLTLDSKVLGLDGFAFELSDENPLTIQPGEAFNCVTRERVFLKDRYVGRIGATTSLARQGILILHGLHVDPGFDGVLQFCVANMGQQDFHSSLSL